MTVTDPDEGAARRRAGFVGLAMPAEGRSSLCQMTLAPGYADFTRGDSPRLGWPPPVE